MLSFRGNITSYNSSIIFKILNNTSNSISSYLRYAPPSYHNMTAEELNMALGDPTVNLLPDIDTKLLFTIIGILCGSALIGYILSRLVNQFILEMTKEKINIPNPVQWFKNKYSQYTNEQVLPLYRPKKAKESPFVGPQPPVILPNCPILDGAEKGQNLQVRFSIPYRRFHSSDNLITEDDHRITITTVVESAKKDPN